MISLMAWARKPASPDFAYGQAEKRHRRSTNLRIKATGEVIDRRHHLSGEIVAGRVLVLPGSRGSSTTSNVLLEAIRAGTAPAAIITLGVDPMLALGSVVAEELYGRSVPVVALEENDYALLRDGDRLAIYPDGTIEL